MVAVRAVEDADLGLIRAVAHQPTLSISGISAWSVVENWSRFEPFIRRLANHDFSVSSIRRLLEARALQLWAGRRGHRIDMVLLTEICDYPMRRSCIVRAVAADSVDDWLPHLGVIEQWAIDKGCQAFEVYAQPEWECELVGWRKTNVVLQKEL